MEKKTICVNGKKVEINSQYYVLVTDPNASFEDYGWDKNYMEWLLEVDLGEQDSEWLSDSEALNDLGVLFGVAVGVERNMQKSVMYYEMAASLNNDLARSNLADIYRKGSYGIPLNHERAFELYKECKLPYAFFRVGEYYENGYAGPQDITKAKEYYRIAYEADHGLAHKKLQTFNFLAD